MENIKLTDFIENVYEIFGLTREEGIGEAIWGSKRTDVYIPVYKGERHIDDMPLSAYMTLAELNILGGNARSSELFKDVDLSGYSDGHISGLLACLATRGFVQTNAQTSPVVLAEGKDGNRHIQKPDGSTHIVHPDGTSQGISVGGPPPGSSTNEYMLNDLKPYHVELAN